MSELFDQYASCEHIHFKYAKGASSRVGKEFHLFHELILFLGGEAELISETVHSFVKPDSVILIPKETYHRFVIHGRQEEYFRCILQFEETEEIEHLFGEDLKEIFITQLDEHLEYLFGKAVALAKEGREAKGLLEAILVLILDEICTKKREPISYRGHDALTQSILHYLSQHLTERVSLEGLASALNVSPSTVTKSFRKNMNISVHKYLLQKRLILAHKEISKGKAPSAVAEACGFSDYSGFYRQYKKMFEASPSQHLSEKRR